MSEITDSTTRREGEKISPWILSAACILLFALSSACFFRGVWNPLNTIDGADSSLWVPMFVQKWTQGLFVPRWAPHYLAGIAQQYYFLSHDLPLILTLPPHRFHGFQFMLDTFLAGAFMFAFLRSRGLGRFGALVGGLSYQLGNNLLTTASLGGMWKFQTACWVPLFLLFFCRVIDGAPNRARNCLFAGATLGLQFLGGEVQLAYYVCLVALAYFGVESAYKLWSVRGVRPFSGPLKDEGRRMLWGALCAAVGLVFAAEVFCTYASFARGNENVGVRSEEDNWKFVTEFSFPPEETVSLALTGRVFGTDAYSRGYQGRPIARISDDYIGIVVLMFAFLALFDRKRQTYFFAAVAVAALVISYGNYFPLLFKLVYALPGMKGLRVPHKWLFITALCVPVLAGIGADFWRNAPPSKNRKILLAIALFFLLATGLAYLSPAITGAASRGTSSAVQRTIAVLFLAALACLVGRNRKVRESKTFGIALPLIVAALLAGDLAANASRFIKYYDYRDRFEGDELAARLRSEPQPFRVKLWSENPHLRKVMTEVLPYYGIGVVDVIMSRRPARYSEVFLAAREGRLSYERLFQLFNVKYILSASPIRGVDIPLKPAAVFGKDSAASSAERSYVYEFEEFLPRAYVVDRFDVSKPEDAIDAINDPDFDPRRAVVLEKQPGPTSAATAAPGPKWSVEDISRSPHRVGMRVTVDRPAILVLQDFMDPRWRARIDKEEVEILRANYLMRAIVVPEGMHDVTFMYDPPTWGYAVTLACWIITTLIAVFCIVGWARSALRAGGPNPDTGPA